MTTPAGGLLSQHIAGSLIGKPARAFDGPRRWAWMNPAKGNDAGCMEEKPARVASSHAPESEKRKPLHAADDGKLQHWDLSTRSSFTSHASSIHAFRDSGTRHAESRRQPSVRQCSVSKLSCGAGLALSHDRDSPSTYPQMGRFAVLRAPATIFTPVDTH